MLNLSSGILSDTKSCPYLAELEGVPLLTFETTVVREGQLVLKRAIDVVFSGVGVLILGLRFSVIAITIELTSRADMPLTGQRQKQSELLRMDGFRSG